MEKSKFEFLKQELVENGSMVDEIKVEDGKLLGHTDFLTENVWLDFGDAETMYDRICKEKLIKSDLETKGYPIVLIKWDEEHCEGFVRARKIYGDFKYFGTPENYPLA